MPGSFTSLSIFAYDLDDRGQPIHAWETVVGYNDEVAIKEAKEYAGRHAGILAVKREGQPAVVEEGDPIIVFQSCRMGDFD